MSQFDGDIRSHVVEQGAGEPMVFVHGSFATPSTWKKLIERLAPTHQCIALRLPGHGGMPDPQDFEAPSIDTELDWLAAVARQLVGDRPIHLVGHSYGGVVALAQALKGNLPLASLTLFEPVATWVLDAVNDQATQAQVQAFLQGYRRDAALGLPDVCGQVIDFWGGADNFAALPPHIRAVMVGMVPNNLRHWDICTRAQHTAADLACLNVPTRLVCGTQSNQVAHAIVNHLHRLLPHSRRWEIEGASHGLVTSHADACASVLLG
ncbi:MAG: alpha/beta fold hydrolase [Rubrivivax sp.]|nr:MAG: alpha/beta fold hydrolase [Rubrivivax sp.]